MIEIIRKDKAGKWSNVAGVFAVLWMCVIFAFSAQTKEESSVVSEGLSYRMASTTGWLFHLNIDEEQIREIATAIERSVRKCAHMTEFGILAILIFVWMGRWPMTRMQRTWQAIALTALYACSDEFHQLFVRGRAGQISDVIVDSLGGVLGLISFLLLRRIICYVPVFRRTVSDTGQEDCNFRQ